MRKNVLLQDRFLRLKIKQAREIKIHPIKENSILNQFQDQNRQ